ncbi:hypothetical protein BS78_01G191300 [Paspalum vaginatum]|nr:hypothetical protein BS78_01G191300 [Paspalum vaginatum]
MSFHIQQENPVPGKSPAQKLAKSWRTIQQLKNLDPEEYDEDTMFLCRVSLIDIDCSDGCRCGPIKKPIHWYKLKAKVQDATGTMSLMIFCEVAEELVGVSAEELVDEIEDDDEWYTLPDEIKDLVGSTHTFQVFDKYGNGSFSVKSIMDHVLFCFRLLLQVVPPESWCQGPVLCNGSLHFLQSRVPRRQKQRNKSRAAWHVRTAQAAQPSFRQHYTMKPAATGIASLLFLLLAAAATAGAVTFEVANNATATPGGQRFDRDYGLDHAAHVLADASFFTWAVFNQTSPAERRPVDRVTFVVTATDGIAYTDGSTVVLNAGYVNNYTGDVRAEVTGVLYHETVHVWQWGLQDYDAHWWVYEGIADFVRLRAGYAPAHWVRPGQGGSWDKGYDVTARFLDYCDSLRPGFVAVLNAKLKNGYSDDYFVQILGKCVQELWLEYKAKYAQ